VKQAATPAWLDLFDIAQAENVCELVREDAKAQRLSGFRPRLHVPIRTILIQQLNSYVEHWGGFKDSGVIDLQRSNIVAAFNFLVFAEDLAVRVEKRRMRMSDADRLFRLWIDFIANGSAHRIYDDLPRELTAAATRKARASAAASRSRKGKLPTANVLADEMKKLRGKRGAAAIIARFHGVTPAAVRKKLRPRREPSIR
jgi:hypothetical protein